MITILTTMVLVFLLQVLLYSWWWIILIPLLMGFFEKDSAAKASLGNGLGVFLLWFWMSIFKWVRGGEIIVGRISEVMGVSSGMMLIFATGMLGFIVAAVAGYGGFSLRRVLLKEYQIS